MIAGTYGGAGSGFVLVFVAAKDDESEASCEMVVIFFEAVDEISDEMESDKVPRLFDAV